MVRPRKVKVVGFEPEITYFKPRAIPLSELEEVEITFDELETLRLSSIENLNQTDAAFRMRIHQSTFQRTLNRAREKVTDALVNGKAIKIHGGEYKMPGNGRGPGGQGRGRGYGRGAPETCRCSGCGEEIPHIRGQPCITRRCPKCGSMMVRGDIRIQT
ncbi:MAG: DUF134 domain-containing protein [archaeon]